MSGLDRLRCTWVVVDVHRGRGYHGTLCGIDGGSSNRLVQVDTGNTLGDIDLPGRTLDNKHPTERVALDELRVVGWVREIPIGCLARIGVARVW